MEVCPKRTTDLDKYTSTTPHTKEDTVKNKPIPALLLALLLLALLLPLPKLALQAEEIPRQIMGSQLIDQNDRILSYAWFEDTLHILTGNEYYRWQPGQAQAQVIPGQRIHHFFARGERPPGLTALLMHEGQLLAIDGANGVVYTAQSTPEGLALTEKIALDWSDFTEGRPPDSYVDLPSFYNILNGQLFVRRSNYGEKSVDLYSYSLEDGTKRVHSVTLLNELIAYKDGQILSVQFDQNKVDPETYQQYPADFVVINPADDSLSTLPISLPSVHRHGVGGNIPLYYDQAGDALYVLNGQTLTSLADMNQPQALAHLPVDSGFGVFLGTTPAIQPYRDDLVFIAVAGNLFIRSLDPGKQQAQVTLRINEGYLDSKILRKTLLALENIRLEPHSGGWLDPQTVQNMFITQSLPFDLLLMDSENYDPQKLMQKGYLYALDGSQPLVDYASDAFDLFDQVTWLDGQLYLLPLGLSPSMVGFHTKGFAEIGRDFPTSIPELIALATWWGEEGHKTADGYVFFDLANAKYYLRDLAFEAYKASYYSQGKQLHFDMETFGSIMQQIDALKTDSWELPPNYGSGEEEEYLGEALIIPYMGYDPLYAFSSNRENYQVLSFDGKEKGFVRAHNTLIAIPASSTQKEEALRFLTAYVQNMAPIDRATLSKTWSEPIENPNYQQEIQQQEQYLAQVQERYDKAQGAEKSQLEQELTEAKHSLEQLKTEGRYLMNAEDLQQHQQLMAQVFVYDSFSSMQKAP